MIFSISTILVAVAVAASSAAQVVLGSEDGAPATSPPFLPSPTPKYAAATGGIIGASLVVAILFFLLDCYLVPLAPETVEAGNGYDESSKLLDKAAHDSSEDGDSVTYMGRRSSMPEIAVTGVSLNAAQAAEVGVVSDMIEAVSALSSVMPRQGASASTTGHPVGRGKAPSILSDPALSAETLTRSQAQTQERTSYRARGPSRGSRASSDNDTSASRVHGSGASPAAGRQEDDMGVTDDEDDDRSAASSYTNKRTGLTRLRAAMCGSTNNTVRAGTALAPRPQSSSEEDQDD